MINHKNMECVVSFLSLYKIIFTIKDKNGKIIFKSEDYDNIENNIKLEENNIYYNNITDQYYEYQKKDIVVLDNTYEICAYFDITRYQKEIIIGKQDKITTLPNRRMVDKMCEACEEKEVIFVLCDIDDFKGVNDSFGHQVGDYVLRKIGTIFKRNMGPNDFVGRYGGEEFLMMFATDDLKLVLKTLKKIRKEIEHEIDLEDDSLKVRFSSGISKYKKELGIDEVIKRADEALYFVKKNGKNNNAIFNETKKDYEIV